MTVAHHYSRSRASRIADRRLPAPTQLPAELPHLPKQHIPSLDGVRGIAILAVFLLHYTESIKHSTPVGHVVLAVFKGGWMGVDLFFVLSGFLITRILLESRDQQGYFANFWARRALRLFPLMYGSALVFLLLTPVLNIHWRMGHIGYLLYLTNVVSYVNPALNFPSPRVYLFHLWSLSVEEQFYIVWPLVIFFCRRRRSLVITSIVLCGLALAIRLICYKAGIVNPWFLYTQTICRMDSLAMGALAALLSLHPAFSSASSLLLKRGLLLISLVLVICIGLRDGTFQWHFPWMETVGFSAIALLAASLIMLAIEPNSMMSRAMSCRPLRICGRYSYGLYLFHVFLKPALEPLLPRLETSLGSPAIAGVAYVCVCFSACMTVSVLSFELFERPILRFKKYFGGISGAAHRVQAA